MTRTRFQLPDEEELEAPEPESPGPFFYGLMFREASETDWPTGFKWSLVELGRLSALRKEPQFASYPTSVVFAFGVVSSASALGQGDRLRLGLARWKAVRS
jgi:hypothetical protein